MSIDGAHQELSVGGLVMWIGWLEREIWKRIAVNLIDSLLNFKKCKITEMCPLLISRWFVWKNDVVPGGLLAVPRCVLRSFAGHGTNR